MRVIEKTRPKGRNEEMLQNICELERYFARLELQYHFCLFVSGLCLLWVTEHLGWIAGIGWFFFSKVVAMILVKLESMKIESDVMSCMKQPSGLMTNLNWNNLN